MGEAPESAEAPESKDPSESAGVAQDGEDTVASPTEDELPPTIKVKNEPDDLVVEKEDTAKEEEVVKNVVEVKEEKLVGEEQKENEEMETEPHPVAAVAVDSGVGNDGEEQVPALKQDDSSASLTPKHEDGDKQAESSVKNGVLFF